MCLNILVSLLLGLGGLLVELVADGVTGSLETGADTSVVVLGLLPVKETIGISKCLGLTRLNDGGESLLVGFLGGGSGGTRERFRDVVGSCSNCLLDGSM